MKKTLLAAIARRVGARRVRRRRRRRRRSRRRRPREVPASASQSSDGFIAYLQLLVASMADMLEPVDTSAVAAAGRRRRRADQGRLRAARVAGASATLSIAPMRSLHALTGALAAGLFFACAAGVGRRGADHADARRRGDRGAARERRQPRARTASCASASPRVPTTSTLATAVARRYLEQARESGDPRFAGLALAALRAWPDASAAPDDVLLLRATLEQYLHEFDAAVAHLRLLLARPGSERQTQAWLTLATVLRVQGRYARVRRRVSPGRPAPAEVYATACLAENAALRGETAAARRSFETMLGDARAAGGDARLADDVARRARGARRLAPAAADAAYRSVLRLGPDTYAAIAYADFLIAQTPPGATRCGAEGRVAHRHRPAAPRHRRNAGRAAPPRRATSPRCASGSRLANERPEASVFHGREQAMFALVVERDAERALALARGDVARQREPLDLLVFAQAARASGRREAIEEARRLKASIGLHDRRIDALL